MHSLQSVKRGVKNTQIKIAIKMLVRNNQTLEEISEIVGLDLNTLREPKKVYLIEMRSVIMELKKEIHIKM